jgi:hypothetical protein
MGHPYRQLTIPTRQPVGDAGWQAEFADPSRVVGTAGRARIAAVGAVGALRAALWRVLDDSEDEQLVKDAMNK